MIEYKLIRHHIYPKVTMGELMRSQDGGEPIHLCWTLEDEVRPVGVKIPKETAIPEGRYKLMITYSNRFKKLLPLVCDVPMFQGIRFHGGNTQADTEGCILVADHIDIDNKRIYGSASLDITMRLHNDLSLGEDIWLEVTACGK